MPDSADLTLADVPYNAVYEAAAAAVVRLHLYTTGEIHRLINEAGSAALKILRGEEETELSLLIAQKAKGQLLEDWSDFIDLYTELLGRGMKQAASIPFGILALQHENIVLPAVEELGEGLGRNLIAKQWSEANNAPEIALSRPRDLVLAAVEERRLSDQLSVSERIWQLDRKSKAEFDRILADGIANGRSSWETAGLLEGYLGSGANCPRWTRTRLYQLSKTEIAAGDTTGLVTGSDCDSQGVAYNALRLARNEMQTVFHTASDTIMAACPWIEGEQIVLSSEHPKPDQCDDVASGGEDGDGVYPKGSITLPLHVLCLCIKLAVMMDMATFDQNLKSWLRGGSWPVMDDYQSFVGDSLNVSFMGSSVAETFIWWLLAENLDDVFWE